MRAKEFIAETAQNPVYGYGQHPKTLREHVMREMLIIYYNAVEGRNMTDHIAYNLGDFFDEVENSNDTVLQKSYENLRNYAEAGVDTQATAALKSIRLLAGDPKYTPPPRPPLSADEQAQVDNFVNRFVAALVSHGIRTNPPPDPNKGQGIAESNPVPLGKGDTLRDYVFDEIEQIYQGAITGEDMTDQIADELNDYFNAVKRSKDPLLKQAYDIALRLGSNTPDIQATGALKALRLLSGNPSLVPAPPEPLTPDQQREVDAMVQKMSAAFTGALASRGIKAHPDWNKDKGQLTEFDPGPGGFGPFKVYYEQDYFIGQFPTYEEAKGKVDFLRQSDPKSATHHWRIVDGTGETVWEYDIGDEIDYHRRSQKFQKRP